MIITIDGPSSAGKSTLAERLAKDLDYKFISSGYLYRKVALGSLNGGIKEGIEFLSRSIKNPELLRTKEIDFLASEISKNLEVRKAINTFLQNTYKDNIVLEGRDMASVFPKAELKIYLTASLEERAKRRAFEVGRDKKDVLEEIKVRDYNDSTREISPLYKSSEMIEVDNTNLTIEETIEKIKKLL